MSWKGKRLTVGDRIMILLLGYTRFRGELQAPIDVTQDGIADNLGIIRSAVPRAVGSLMNRNLVEENLAHIDGLTRRRKIYLLTDEGIMAARELLDDLGSTRVEVREKGEARTDTIINLYHNGDLDLRSLADVLNSGVLDRDRVEEKKEEKKGHTLYIHSLTPPDIFLGREREIEEIKSAISSQTRKVTVIYGIAGVGKTTLSWKITQMFRKEMNIFYIDLKEWTSISYVLRELGEFLARSGWTSLRSYIDTTREVDIEAVCDLLKEKHDENPYLIIFDDLHRAPEEVTMFLSSLKERLRFMKHVNLIILSRKRAEFYDIRDVRIHNLVGELELLGFDKQTSIKFLLERGFKEDEVDTIIERTGGHPLALVLVEREGYNYDIADFDQFLTEEIFNKLTKDELRLLGLLSLSRLQLGEDDLRRMVPLDADLLRSLMDHHLIFGTPGGYVIHDLIRDQAVSNISRRDRKEAHLMLSGLFHDKLSSMGFHQDIEGMVPPYPFGIEDETGLGPVPLYVSEEVHQLLGAGRPEEAMKVLLMAHMQIPTKDLLKEAGRNTLKELPSSMTAVEELEKRFLIAVMDILEDDHEKALKAFYRILADGIEGMDDLTGSIKECIRLWSTYLEERVHGPEKALAAIEELEVETIPPRLRYYFHVTKASLLYKMGDHKGAAGAYKTFLAAIIDNEELPLKLKESLQDSMEKARGGSIQVATDNFQRIMELTASNRDVLREEMPFVDVDHHLLSAIYSLYHGNR
ncbi:MAG: AAA family ATPase [Candidatus Thermoplasmatota archaeon]|nr:AAA family ATPase [Candidatus Thermoplasmatota archaeon]